MKPVQTRTFRSAIRLKVEEKGEGRSLSSNAIPAEELNNKISEEEQRDYDQRVAHDKQKQIRTPWHREGSDEPPVARQRSAGAMTKGACH
jgi:hypothetical protein